MAPETASFKISYEVAAQRPPGPKFFYNPIRKGSAASDEAVYDAMLGTPLHFEVVSGAQARKRRVDARCGFGDQITSKSRWRGPFPEHGQGRVLVVKTYQDAKSYYLDGKTLVFNRPLGVKRNKVVLPAGI